jgi:hypothetical protein
MGDYHLYHQDSVIQLRNELRARCAINDEALENAISFAKNGDQTAENVHAIIVRFWDLARNVNV